MSGETWRLPFGANCTAQGVEFRVWAPGASEVMVVLEGGPTRLAHPLRRDAAGYHAALISGVPCGTRYQYLLDQRDLVPDPASRFQPEGVHGPSVVVDPTTFRWTDGAWGGLAMAQLAIYELHVGTFTPAGTFDAAIERLDDVAGLGVGAIEIMPVAQFPGNRNWGYDGVGWYAPAAVYGGPEGLRRLADAAHQRGLGVILDVVYNHLGPDGNYLPRVTGGRFFTPRHQTPWGPAINYDGPDSGPVREFAIQNAIYWAREYHVDGLRLDATHAIRDDSPVHLLKEIAEALHSLSPRRLVIGEDERNERRLVLPPRKGGLGLDAVWADDLHHQLRRRTAGDSESYFADFSGSTADIVATLRAGWFYHGQSTPRGGRRGTPGDDLPSSAFVHCIQNHDQVGNRALGDRLHHEIPLEQYRALSALLLVSPYPALLWMGQEWAASSPFLYFTDHPPGLGRMVTEGRREEFKTFSAFSDPAVRHRIPDPQSPDTFHRSKLSWGERLCPPHSGMLELYRVLLETRNRLPAPRAGRAAWSALGNAVLALRRESAPGGAVVLIVNLGGPATVRLDQEDLSPAGRGPWRVTWDTAEPRFGGSGNACRLSGGELWLAGPVAVLLE